MRAVDLPRELLRAARRLARRPTWSLAVVITLALGVGGLAAVWSLAAGVLFEPIGYAEVERLVRVTLDLPAQEMRDHWLSPPEFFELVEADSFGAAGAYMLRDGNVLVGEQPLRAQVGYASAGLLEMLAPRPVAGRLFTAEEDNRSATPVVLLGHGLWTRLFAADPERVGETIEVDGQARTVVGVLPAGFDLEEHGVELVVPLALDPGRPIPREARFLYVLGRLAPDATTASATDELAALAEAAPRAEGTAPPEPRVRPLREALLGPAADAVGVLAAAVVLVLLLAAVDVFHLFLVRRETRRRESAVREALGAGRTDLAWPFLAEIVVLTAPAALFGWLGARWGLEALIALHAGALPRLAEVTVDAAAFGVALAVALGVAVAVTVLPDLLGRFVGGGRRSGPGVGSDLGAGLAAAASNEGLGPRGRYFRRAVVVAETALATVLLLAAALLARDLADRLAIDPGFDVAGVTTGRISLPFGRYREPGASGQAFEALVDDLESRPNIAAAGVLSEMPLERDSVTNPVEIEGREGGPATVDHFSYVTPGIFRALGMPIVAGRGFERGLDSFDSAPVAVVSETFARALVPGGTADDAVGGKLRVALSDQLPWVEIVGVAGDIVQVELERAPQPEIWLLQSQATRTVGALPLSMFVVARAESADADLAGELRAAVHALDATLPIARLRPLADVVDGALAEARLLARLVAVFAMVALGLAVVGVYGVLGFAVERRRREMSVRQAMGAPPSSLLRLVLVEGLAAVGLGIGLGVALAWGTVPRLAARLGGLAPSDLAVDPGIWLGVPALLLAVAAIACAVPAWRAARVAPAELSRHS